MMRCCVGVVLLFLHVYGVFGYQPHVNPKPQTVPAIVHWEGGVGEWKLRRHESRILGAEEKAKEAAGLLSDDVKELLCVTLPVDGNFDNVTSADITLKLIKDDILGEQGYRMNTTGPVQIEATTYQGLVFATRTFLQIYNQHLALPVGYIEDKPASPWRFYFVDMGRKYWKVSSLKNYFRRMSWVKMTHYIFHIVESEGFRLQAPSFKELWPNPEVAYTREEVEDLVKFANRLGIDVIPGYEFPGHNSVINAAYGVGLGGKCENYTTTYIYADYVMDLTKPDALDLTQRILAETLPWFNSKYVHIGADEIWASVEECPYIKNYIKEHPEEGSLGEMSIRFCNTLNKQIKEMGRRTIIFNGLEKVATDTLEVDKDIIMHWWDDNWDYVKTLEGYDVISSDSWTKKLDGSTVPADLYLTPNNWNNHFPDGENLLMKWELDFNILGYGIAVWPDYTFYGEDEYFEDLGNSPRAIAAARGWNPEFGVTGTTWKEFDAIMERIGEAPGVTPDTPMQRHDKLKLIHQYDMETRPYPSGYYQAEPYPNVWFVKDLVGDAHMSTYASGWTAKGPGHTGELAMYMKRDTDGMSLGFRDYPAPWTYSLWLNLDKTLPDSTLAFNRFAGALKASMYDSDVVGYTAYTPYRIDVRSHVRIPLGEYHHLVFSATERNTSIYLDGEFKEELPGSIPLPMMSFSGMVPHGSRRPIKGRVDDIKIFDGAANREQVKKIFEDGEYAGDASSKPLPLPTSEPSCPIIYIGETPTETTTGKPADPEENGAPVKAKGLAMGIVILVAMLRI